MENFLLLATVLATFIFGWFIMKKLDVFLDENWKAQAGQAETDETVLRIGLAADSIAEVLEKYSRQFPDSCICLFQGGAEDLLEKIAAEYVIIKQNGEEVAKVPDGEYSYDGTLADMRRKANGFAKTKSGAAITRNP